MHAEATQISLKNPREGSEVFTLGDQIERLRIPSPNREWELCGQPRRPFLQPFDARSAQISGNAVPIAESVSVPGPTLIMMTASENGVLVYRTYEGEAGMNQIVWFDRAGKRLGFGGAPGNVRTPSISPDEKKVASTSLTSSGTADLWLWDLIRGTETRLTSDSSLNVGPSWAPDGKHIVFRSNQGGSAGDLYQASASGSGQAELLLATPRGKVDPEWSRDGRFVVYSGSDPKTKFDLWVLPVGDDAPAGRKPMPSFLLSKGTYTNIDVPEATAGGGPNVTGISPQGGIVGSYADNTGTGLHGFLLSK